MKTYDVVIVGAGEAGAAAASKIRELDETASLLIIGEEDQGLYERPPLSKDLWDKPDQIEDIFYEVAEDETIDRIQADPVVELDRKEKTVQTKSGQKFAYGHLLLATGGTPNRLKGPESEHVLTYRYLDDFKHVQKLIEEGAKNFAFVGGGFISCEIAASVLEEGLHATLIHPDQLLGERTFPEEIAKDYHQSFLDHGAEVIGQDRVASYDLEGDQVIIQTEAGKTINADVLVMGMGIRPNNELAEAAGLKVDDGIVVDEYFQTSDPYIYSAGDVAQYPDIIQGSTRIEHDDHATSSGRRAAENIMGEEKAYTYIPLFYSDLFDIEYEGYGDLNAQYNTIIEDLDEGKLVYYLDGDEPKGFLNWKVYVNRKEIRQWLKQESVDLDTVKGSVQK